MYNTIQSLLSCFFLLIGFLILCKHRYSLRRMLISSAAILFLCFGLYVLGLRLGLKTPAAAAICLTIPSFLLCGQLSGYRDFRYVFTFCSADLFGIVIMGLCNAFNMVMNFDVEDNRLVAIEYLLMFSVLYIFFWRVRKEYLEIQETQKKGWGSLALLSVTLYAMIYVLMGYPAPIRERKEYLPVFTFVLIAISLTYIVIFQFIQKMKQQFEAEEIKQRLHTEQKEKELYSQMAYVDYMTKMKNRAYLAKREQEFQADWEKVLPLTCITLDINNLKQINDNKGHAAGDSVILRVAGILKKVFPGTEDIYRLGGDEFLVLLLGQASWKASVASIVLELERNNAENEIQITAAVGAFVQREKGLESFTSSMKRADEYMYEDKRKYKERYHDAENKSHL